MGLIASLQNKKPPYLFNNNLKCNKTRLSKTTHHNTYKTHLSCTIWQACVVQSEEDIIEVTFLLLQLHFVHNKQ